MLLFAARVAKKRGLGQGNGLIEVVARQRMGRTSTVNVVRIADLVLVVGATEEQVTLLAEVDSDAVDAALNERRAPTRIAAAETGEAPAVAARSTVAHWPGRCSTATAGAASSPAPRAHGPPIVTAAVRPSTRRRAALVLLLALLCTVAAVLLAGPASAAPTDPVAPTAPTAPVVPGDGNVDISIGDGSPSSSITLILAITVLSVAPSCCCSPPRSPRSSSCWA